MQREWMDSAVRHYGEHSDMPEYKIYIWLDILSIPQSNREVQTLAVDSLYGTRELAAVAVSGERGACCERPAAMEPRADLSSGAEPSREQPRWTPSTSTPPRSLP